MASSSARGRFTIVEILLSFFPMIQLARQLLTRQLRLPIFLQDGEENVLEACAGKLDGARADERIRKEIEEGAWL